MGYGWFIICNFSALLIVNRCLHNEFVLKLLHVINNMAFRIVFPEYFIGVIVIICQLLFVIACHTSYVNYYSIWTVEMFSVNSPNMFKIQIVMHVFVLIGQS